MTTVQLLNAMYAVARKKTEMNHQERTLVRTAAGILERALKEIKRQRAVIEELEERIAIMEEAAGELEDDGTEPWVEEQKEKEDDFWDDFWPI